MNICYMNSRGKESQCQNYWNNVQLYKWNLNELFWKYKIKKEAIIETGDMISMKKIRIEPPPYFYFVLLIVFLFYFLLLCFSHLFCDEIMEDTQESNCLNSTRSLVPMDLSLFTVKWKNEIFVWSFLMFKSFSKSWLHLTSPLVALITAERFFSFNGIKKRK